MRVQRVEASTGVAMAPVFRSLGAATDHLTAPLAKTKSDAVSCRRFLTYFSYLLTTVSSRQSNQSVTCVSPCLGNNFRAK